jgi:periplasmic protein TonB
MNAAAAPTKGQLGPDPRKDAGEHQSEGLEVDYADSQRSWGKHAPSIIFVIILHIAVGYALVSGLARKVVDVIKQPLETKIIEEVKKVIPDTPPPPPPKLATPPPPFIPPPEVNIQVPVQAVQQAITTVTTVQPPPSQPAPRVVQEAPAVRKNFSPVARVQLVFPRDAIKKGIEKGLVIAHAYVQPNGTVSEVRIISANPPRVFDREVIRGLSQWRFNPEPVGFIAEFELEFKLTD